MVYCGKCKHYFQHNYSIGSIEQCKHYSSVTYIDTYRERIRKYGRPKELNKNNDCKLYTERRLT